MLPQNKQLSVHWKRKNKKGKQNAQPEAVSGADCKSVGLLNHPCTHILEYKRILILASIALL